MKSIVVCIVSIRIILKQNNSNERKSNCIELLLRLYISLSCELSNMKRETKIIFHSRYKSIRQERWAVMTSDIENTTIFVVVLMFSSNSKTKVMWTEREHKNGERERKKAYLLQLYVRKLIERIVWKSIKVRISYVFNKCARSRVTIISEEN